MRAEARGEAHGVLEVVLAALREVDAGQFGVGLLVIGYGRDQAGVKGAHRYHVLERSSHRVAGEALHVGHYHLVGGSAESAAQGFHFGRGGAAAGRGIGLVRHEHRVRRYLFLLKAVDVLNFLYEPFHLGRDMLGVEAGHVVARVGAFGEEQARERHHAAAAGQRLVLYHHAYGGRTGYKAVAAAVEGQRGLGDVLLGGGGAGGQEAGHGPALHLAVGHVVGGYDYHAFALAGAYPGLGREDGFGGGGAGGAHMYGRALGAHPLGELGVGYRYHFQQEVLAEGVGVGVLLGRQVLLQPLPEGGLVALLRQFVHDGIIKLPHLLGGTPGVFLVEVAGGFLYQLFGGREGRGEDHAGLGGQRFGQRPFLGQIAAGGGLLVIMDQRQAGVLHGEYAGAYGHLERRAEGFGHGMRQAEFLLHVYRAYAGGELYGLVHRFYLLYAVVARRGFHHAHDVLVHLLGAPLAGYGLYHVLAREDLVEVGLAEQAVPRARRAARYAGHGQRVEVEAVFLGEVRLAGGERGPGRSGRAYRRGRFKRPVLVVGVEELPALPRCFAFPLHGYAEGGHIGQQVVELGDAAALGMVGGQHGDVALVLKRGGSESAQHALGAALDESAHAFRVHPLQLLYEFHRARHLLYQHVVDALVVSREEVRGHVRQDLHVGGLYRYALEEVAVRAHGRLDDLGMEGVAHGDLPRLDAHGLEQAYGFFNGLRLAGYHGLLRAVLVGADDVAFYLFQLRVHLVAAEGHGSHLAGVFHFHIGHFLGPVRYGAQAVLEGEDAGRGGGGVLAQGVAYGHVGLYAEFLEQAVHRYVGRHHGRLGELRLLYGFLALGQGGLVLAGLAPDGLGEADADHFLQDDVGLVEGLLHHFIFGGEVAHHVHVLRPLAGEKQAHLGLVGAGPEGVNALQLEIERQVGPGPGLGMGGHEVDLFHKVLRGLGHYGNAPRGLGPGHAGLGVDGHGIGPGPPGENGGGFRLRFLYHFLRRISGEGHGLALYAGERGLGVLRYLDHGGGFRRAARFGVALLVRAGVLFHQHVEVGAAETERRDVGAAYAVLGPGRGLVYDLEEVQVYAGVGLHIIDGGGQRLVIDRESGLGYGDRAGRGLAVPYLGLHRGEAQFLAVAHVRAEHFLQHLHFGRVAHLGGGAVGFHEIHVGRAVVHLGEGVLYGDLLAFGVGRGDALALAVGGSAYRVDQRVYLVTVAHGVGHAF